MDLTTSQKKKLKTKLLHAFGVCNCKPSSKSCLYWELVDEGGEAAVEDIIKEISKL